MSSANLFSIDVAAHLKKAASHTFGSPGHYPVEWVRAALRRGATEVDLQITRNRLQVQDNGPGLSTADLALLTALMDPDQPDSLKEEAVESIQLREHLGLLAIFAPHPGEILVENSSADGHSCLHLREEGFEKTAPLTSPLPLSAGTRLTLKGARQRDTDLEKQLLEAFCRSVTQQVRLNHRWLGWQRLLTGQLATLKLPPSARTGGGEVGIPRAGGICHLRLLDQGIPWHHFTLPPQQGFIFDAALETTADLTAARIGYLCQSALRLYRWLRNRYYTATPGYRERIQELLFTQCRLSGDDSLLLQFAPFDAIGSRRSLTLSQVRKEAAAGTLYAVPWHKSHLRYNTGGKTVLSLTRQQADLLINHLNIPIPFLHPVTGRRNPLPGQWHALKRRIRHLLSSLLPIPGKIVEPGQLTGGEQRFLEALNRYLPGKRARITGSRGLFPVIFTGKKEEPWLIRRHHPLVRRAVRAVREDSRNIEIFVPLFFPSDSHYTKYREET